MKIQTYKNHRQVVYGYYLTTALPLLIFLILSIRFLAKTGLKDHLPPLLFLLLGWVLVSLLFRSRGFALIAQDRAIRAEEGLRYFILTGKRLDTRLTMAQIIALRFASDEELPSLVEKAVSENLSNKQIKQAIRNWRADLHRV